MPPSPPVGEAQLRPQSCDEPAPLTEQDVVMEWESIVDESVVDKHKARTRKSWLDKGSHLSGNPVQSMEHQQPVNVQVYAEWLKVRLRS